MVLSAALQRSRVHQSQWSNVMYQPVSPRSDEVCQCVLGLLTMIHVLQVCWLQQGHQHHLDFLLKRLQLEIWPQGRKGLTCPMATNVLLAETQSSMQSLPVLPSHTLLYGLTVVPPPPQVLPNPPPPRYHLYGQAQMSGESKAIDEVEIVQHHRCGDPSPHTGQQQPPLGFWVQPCVYFWV